MPPGRPRKDATAAPAEPVQGNSSGASAKRGRGRPPKNSTDKAAQPDAVATTASSGATERDIATYRHPEATRPNNPPVGLVNAQNDPDQPPTRYAFDPHLDPQLAWAGKAEKPAMEVPTVSLHVHERIDPFTIINQLRKTPAGDVSNAPRQLSLFETPWRDEPLRTALDFYRHESGWTNRMIAGDSLLVMNSLLVKEGFGSKVQMVFFDPPYGIKYGSNFQPFVNKRDVTDGRDEDLTSEPEMLTAFRDTWELGIHSYLSYLRDRLTLMRDMLTESGSIFVQISDENLHHVREVMDEVFGSASFVSVISFKTTGGLTRKLLSSDGDFLIWYCKNPAKVKYRELYLERGPADDGAERYDKAISPDGMVTRRLTPEEFAGRELPQGWSRYQLTSLTSQGYREATSVPWKWNNKVFDPGRNLNWKTSLEGLERLANAHRIEQQGTMPRYRRCLDDFPLVKLTTNWTDTQSNFAGSKLYVVQTNEKVIQRCMLMTTDPGDLVFDPTCGSGTTSFVAEQWGRRWMTCDTSRVAITLAKQRLMISGVFDYFRLKAPVQGVSGGFQYRRVPHITLGDTAHNPLIRPGMSREEAESLIRANARQEDLYDQPEIDKSKVRVCGPFTLEAVPAPAVTPLSEISPDPATGPEVTDLPPLSPNASIARSGETARQAEWRSELQRAGVRAKNGSRLRFANLEAAAGCRYLHALGEVCEGDKTTGKRIAVSFGPPHAPLEQKQIERAMEEAHGLVPRPAIILFAAFQFDPEAAKDIDGISEAQAGMLLLKAQMTPDLLTDDLKKKRINSETFWLIGQPDVELRRCKPAEVAKPATPTKKGAPVVPPLQQWQVEVRGFDYFDPRTGDIVSGGSANIAVWMLDPDYDGRSLFPRQVLFPLAGEKDGWARVAKTLKAEIDEDKVEHLRGTVSLPFVPGRRVAVKIVDDRGIESLRVMEVPL